MPIAAAVRIQACWRAVRVRRRIQPCTRLLLRRAAVAIQRWWRACECVGLGQLLGSSGRACPGCGQPRAAPRPSCLSGNIEQAGRHPHCNRHSVTRLTPGVRTLSCLAVGHISVLASSSLPLVQTCCASACACSTRFTSRPS